MVPVVVAVVAVTVLVAAHTLLFVSWFCSFYDAYVDGNGAVPVPALAFYRHYYALAAPVALAIFGVGARLALRSEARATHLAWYACLSGISTFAWFVFTLLVERILLFEYGLPA